MADNTPASVDSLTNSQTEFWGEFDSVVGGQAKNAIPRLGSDYMLLDEATPKTPPYVPDPEEALLSTLLPLPSFSLMKVDTWTPLQRNLSHSKLKEINPYNVPHLQSTDSANSITQHTTTISKIAAAVDGNETDTQGDSQTDDTPKGDSKKSELANVEEEDEEDYEGVAGSAKRKTRSQARSSQNKRAAVADKSEKPKTKAKTAAKADKVSAKELAEKEKKDKAAEKVAAKEKKERKKAEKEREKAEKEKLAKEKREKEKAAKHAAKESTPRRSQRKGKGRVAKDDDEDYLDEDESPIPSPMSPAPKVAETTTPTTTTTTTTTLVTTETLTAETSRGSSTSTSSSSSSSSSRTVYKQAAVAPKDANSQVNEVSKKEAAARVKEVQISTSEYTKRIEKMYGSQCEVLNAGRTEQFPALVEEITKMMTKVDSNIKQLDSLSHAVIMEPSELVNSRTLREILVILLIKLDLLQKELAAHDKPAPQCVAALVFLEQPAPKVIFKGKDLGTYKVELILPSRMRYEVDSTVTPILIMTTPRTKGAAPTNTMTPLPEFAQPLTNDIAEFEALKINLSTRMLPCTIRFSLQLKDRGKQFLLESPPSYSHVFITNESQWAGAVGKLLIDDALEGENSQITWARYANTLHYHFFIVTQQNPEDIQRKFFEWELSYIHAKWFGNKAVLSMTQLDTFWGWFGQVLLTIHFKRKIYEMWSIGTLYGFVSKEDCVDALKNADEGTFIIRFSESVGGAFAIACASGDANDKVKHFIVKPDDLGANKTLPDYLKDRPTFKTILVVDPQTRKLTAQPKQVALAGFVSTKAKKPVAQVGYLHL